VPYAIKCSCVGQFFTRSIDNISIRPNNFDVCTHPLRLPLCWQALGIETEDDIHLLSGYFVKEVAEASRKASATARDDTTGGEEEKTDVSRGGGGVQSIELLGK
jgi:hypothetical protein